jgi:hypothetical protein
MESLREIGAPNKAALVEAVKGEALEGATSTNAGGAGGGME